MIFYSSVWHQLVGATLIVFIGTAFSAPLNKCTLSNGRIEYTDQTCPSGSNVTQTEIITSNKARPTVEPNIYTPKTQHINRSQAPNNINASASQALTTTKPVVTNNGLSTEDRMKSCDLSIALAAAEEVIKNPASLKDPLALFMPASILFRSGKKDEGLFWFYAAQLRVRYQLAFEQGDLGQIMSIMVMSIGPPINNYAFQDTVNLNRTLDRVLEWDKKSANPYRDKPKTADIDKKIDSIYLGLNKLKLKISSEKTTIESDARIAAPDIERSFAMQNKTCQTGKLDTAFAKQTTESEWTQVISFAKNNKDVIREAGFIKDAYPESSVIKKPEILPSRYIVSLTGGKPTFAVIDVSRSSGNAKFNLACITHLSLGKREALKDICSQ